MRGAPSRPIVSAAALAIAFMLLSACTSMASAAPPEPIEMGGDNAHFYSASVPTYASVDGRRTIAFNALMNIYALTTMPADGGAAQVGPTLDVDGTCGLPDFCVRLMGVALSGVPRESGGGSHTKEWTLKSGTFRVMRCLEQDGPACRLRFVSFEGKDGARGWYAISDKRGVEMFGRLNQAGASEDVFVLFAERGVLFRR